MSMIQRTRASRHDYEVIWNYIAADNVTAADKTLRRFDDALELLAKFPRAGPARPELHVHVRSFPVGQYIIFYRIVDGGIELLRVLHGRRDVRRSFRTQSK